MPSFSRRSKLILNECHSDLKKLLNSAISYFDFSVLEARRGEKKQNDYYEKGLSKLKYPQSKHNSDPSSAVHIAPYPISFNNNPKNLARFYFMAGVVKCVAIQEGIAVRWGGDWDGDNDFSDQNFDDLMHFELL